MLTQVLSLPARQGARLLIRDQLETLRTVTAKLASTPSPDLLHDFRVAIRRLRTLLRAYRPHLGKAGDRAIRRQLRAMTRATGTNRDLDVQLAWLETLRQELGPHEATGMDWLVRRLQGRRRALPRLRGRKAKQLARVMKLVEAETAHFCLPADVVEHALQPTLAMVAADLLESLLATFDLQVDGIGSSNDREAAHRARITAKRIRYLLEPLADHVPEGPEVIGQLKSLQDVLGELNDAHQFLLTLAAEIAAAQAKHERRFARAVLRGKVLDETWLRRERKRDPCPGLLALQRRLEHREDAAWEAVARWQRTQAPVLRRRLAEIAASLHQRGARAQEIERKYLLRSLPSLVVGAAAQHIDQGYLPGARLVERVRRVKLGSEERYYRTVKLGTGIQRLEIEEETTAATFQAMWPLTVGKRVRKRRYRVVYGELTWEIDEFLDHPLILAEVELPVATHDPDPPEWLRPYVIRQVSDEPEYLNVNLAC